MYANTLTAAVSIAGLAINLHFENADGNIALTSCQSINVCTVDMAASKRVLKDGEFTEGDLVWGKVKGFPAWPGQVMPVSMAPKHIQTGAKSKSHLIAFFGDSSYGETAAQ